jgi:hypothetical protein
MIEAMKLVEAAASFWTDIVTKMMLPRVRVSSFASD